MNLFNFIKGIRSNSPREVLSASDIFSERFIFHISNGYRPSYGEDNSIVGAIINFLSQSVLLAKPRIFNNNTQEFEDDNDVGIRQLLEIINNPSEHITWDIYINQLIRGLINGGECGVIPLYGENDFVSGYQYISYRDTALISAGRREIEGFKKTNLAT